MFGALAVVGAAQSPDDTVRRIRSSRQYVDATAFIARDYDRFVRELITLTEIPAPPFKERQRARVYMQLLAAERLEEVEQDAEGNVMGVRKGVGKAPLTAVLAHLDTVFPEGTPVKVKRDGTKLTAPGIGDDTRGLVLMLAVIRALDAGHFETAGDILFVGNVGEEGEGDLRGTKYLLQRGKYRSRIKQFVAIDGGDQGELTTRAVGSRRYRVTFSGPGGHSFGAFGLVNPAYALGNAIAEFARTQVPSTPKTTYNVGVLGGGTSVNAIPSQVHMDVDMRSESCGELEKLDDTFLAIVRRAAERENAARSTTEGRIEPQTRTIGERPCGETPAGSAIVQTAAAVVRAFGLSPSYRSGSTDANVPISMGIPAVTIGRGGPGGRAHALDEWTDIDKGAVSESVQVAMTMILAIAGAQ